MNQSNRRDSSQWLLRLACCLPLASILFLIAPPSLAQTVIFSRQGTDIDSRLGYAMARVDFNRDGIRDLVVGAPLHPTESGSVHVYYGGANPDPDEQFDGDTHRSVFGGAVSFVGDVNNDGSKDFLVGARREGTVGAAYIFFGGKDASTRPPRLMFSEPEALSLFGASVGGGDDINGDGIDDFVVGALGNSEQSGSVYVYFGQTGLQAVNPGVRLHGDEPGDGFGGVTTVYDWNGDGLADVFAGAPSSSTGIGKVWVFLGDSDEAALASPDLILEGGSSFGFALGKMILIRGVPAILVGDPQFNDKKGRVSVFLGGVSPDAKPDYVIDGVAENGQLGLAVSGVRDLTGDGRNEIAASVASTVFFPSSRAVLIYDTFGWQPTRKWTIYGGSKSLFGATLLSGVKFDPGGLIDIFVGDPGSPKRGESYGRVVGMSIDKPQPLCSTPKVIRFGDVFVGTTAYDRLTIKNAGDVKLTGRLSVTCNNYSFPWGSSYSINPRDSLDVLVAFTPSYEADFWCTLELDDPCSSVRLEGHGTIPDCPLSVSNLDFGYQDVGTSSPIQTITIHNSGDIKVEGGLVLDQCDAFSVSSGPTYSIEAGETLTVNVRFLPPTKGIFNCTLSFPPCPGSVALTGWGVDLDKGLPATLTPAPLQIDRFQLWGTPIKPRSTKRLWDIFSDAWRSRYPFKWEGFSVSSKGGRNPLLRTGEAYWLNTSLPFPEDFSITGIYPYDIRLPLLPGWNGITNPTQQDLSVASFLVQSADSDTAVSMSEAVAAGWLEASVWKYQDSSPDLTDNGQFTRSSFDTTMIKPWSGLLMCISNPLQLVLNVPVETYPEASYQPPPVEWTVLLTATAAYDTKRSAVLGVAHSSNGVQRIHFPVGPPHNPLVFGLGEEHLYSLLIAPEDDQAWTLTLEGSSARIRMTRSASAPQELAVEGWGRVVSLQPEEPIVLYPGRYVVRPVVPLITTHGFKILSVFPNPITTGGVEVEYIVDNPEDYGSVVFAITDISGRLVYRCQDSEASESRDHTWKWDMTDSQGARIPAGVYWMRASLNNKRQIRKLIVLP